MLIAIKIQIYPNESQIQYINGLLGACRFVYNKGLDFKITQWREHNSSTNISSVGKYITQLKQTQEFSWLSNYHSKVLQQSLLNLDKAYKGFFKKTGGFPNFKSKNSSKQTCRFPVDAIIGITGNRISLIRGLADIHFKCSKKHESLVNKLKPNSITLTKTKSNRYYLSVLVEHRPNKQFVSHGIIGIDIGIKDFIVTSTGEVFSNIKVKRNNEDKLRKLYRNLSSKVKGSNNKEKARRKLAKFSEKLNNQKEHYLHWVSNYLISENQVIIGETLNVKGMMKNHNLAKSIQELSIHRFAQMLEYKANLYGRNFIQLDKWFPSSKLCSCCGSKNTQLTLKDRSWVCGICNTTLDRDHNAAVNILQEGLKLLKNTPEFGEIYAWGEIPLGSSKNQEKNVSYSNFTEFD